LIVGYNRLPVDRFVYPVESLRPVLLGDSELRGLMGEKASTPQMGLEKQIPKNLLNAALGLAIVSAIIHLYLGFTIGYPQGIPLILIALVYLVGVGLVGMNKNRPLFLKVGLVWVVIVIVLWAASAAVNAPNTQTILAYASKAVEAVLLIVLLLLWRKR